MNFFSKFLLNPIIISTFLSLLFALIACNLFLWIKVRKNKAVFNKRQAVLYTCLISILSSLIINSYFVLGYKTLPFLFILMLSLFILCVIARRILRSMEQFKKWNKLLFFCVVMSLLISTAYYHVSYKPKPWHEKYTFIAHALGGIITNGETYRYTNSKEAFKRHYAMGKKIFETDIVVTSDNKIVLRHDWEPDYGQADWSANNYIPTAKEFMSLPYHGKFTPLDLSGLFEIMKQYPDIMIVTDTKSYNIENIAAEFELIIETARQADAMECLERFIIQIQNDEMYDVIHNIYQFENYIYTIYRRGAKNFEQLCEFCNEHDIEVITMPFKKHKESLQDLADEYNLKIYVHTLNNPIKIINKLYTGVSGIYTDFL